MVSTFSFSLDKGKAEGVTTFYRKSACTVFIIQRVLAANPTLSHTEVVYNGHPPKLYKYLRTTVRGACACCQKPYFWSEMLLRALKVLEFPYGQSQQFLPP